MEIRDADARDQAAICELVRELAASLDEESPITEDFAGAYLETAGTGALVADESGGILGLLTYTIRPNLYHAAQTCLIEELVVRDAARGRGVGGALLQELLRRMFAAGWAEVSVTVMPGNEGALRFYRAHGLVDEAVFLERHLSP
jgi:ribosomal protein S18 acetylase RimI-like enzyme